MLSPAGNPNYDEVVTDAASYHAQQAIEKALKYKTEMLGIPYKKTHDLVGLIQVLENNGFRVNDKLRDRASEISGWEAASRYVDSFSAVKSSVEDALELYIELREQILKSVEEIPVSDAERVNAILKNMGVSEFEYEDLKEYLPSVKLDDNSLYTAITVAVKCLKS